MELVFDKPDNLSKKFGHPCFIHYKFAVCEKAFSNAEIFEKICIISFWKETVECKTW